MQVLCFAYIDNLPVLIKVLIHPRIFGNPLQQQSNMIIFPSHFTPYTLFFHFDTEEALYFYTSVCQKLFAVQPL